MQTTKKQLKSLIKEQLSQYKNTSTNMSHFRDDLRKLCKKHELFLPAKEMFYVLITMAEIYKEKI